MPLRACPVLGRAARCLAVAAVLSLASTALGQLRVATYNIVKMQGNPTAVRNVLAAMHADDRGGFAAPIGVIVFNEVTQSSLASLQSAVNLAAPAGVTYALATFTTSSSEDGAGGARAAFYRTDLVAEIASGHQDISTGAGRFGDRWLFQLVGYTSTAARFYVYGAHLKASSGSSNEAQRLTGVQALRANADALGAGVRAIYAGDMNFYTSAESGYQAFVAAGNGAAVDPLGTADWLGSANAWKHTQSPRDIVADGLVGGGMDDRFDFVLPTAQLNDGNGISLIPNSCRAVGNDGAHYNLAINAGNNTYFASNVGRSNVLADDLFAAADHIPVILDLQVPAWSTAELGAVPARVVQGAAATVLVKVANDAPGTATAGIDALDYLVTGSGVLSGSASGVAALTPSFTSVNLPVTTTTVGLRTGTASVTSSNEAVQNPSISLPVSIRVLRRSNPSCSASADVDSGSASFQATAGGAPVEATVSVWNNGFTADQATMDIDSVSVTPGPFSFVGGTATGVGSSAAPLTFRFNPAGLAPGQHSAVATVSTSDENVPGATSAQVTVSLSATVGGGRVGDLDGDGIVSGADLGLLLSAWGAAPGNAADLSGDGTVNGADLGLLLSNWG